MKGSGPRQEGRRHLTKKAGKSEPVSVTGEPVEQSGGTRVSAEIPDEARPRFGKSPRSGKGEHWVWRLRMAEKIASALDPQRFGVQGFYVCGSTKNATAGPGSDIDVVIHFRGNEHQLRELRAWLEGWSLALDEMNCRMTGYRSGGLLDVHFVTDEDIRRKTSYAVMIGAVTDPATPLPMKRARPSAS